MASPVRDWCPLTVADTVAEERDAEAPGARGFRGWLRWIVRPPTAFGGAVGALVFFWLSLLPSLLPRAWLFQGVVSGLTAVIGYGIGGAVGAGVRRLATGTADRRDRVRWVALGGVALVGTVILLVLSHGWQNELRRLMGIEDEPDFSGLGVLLVALLVGSLILLVARMVRSFGRFVIRQVGRAAPPRVSILIGIVLTVLVVVGFAQGFLWRGIVAGLNEGSSVANARSNEGTDVATATERSGGPDSLVSWDSLGRQGRDFVALGPTVADLEAFHGDGCCLQPIRVYTGLDSAGTAAERAALAVGELHRTGAFDREVLAVFTATGTGWINPRVASSLEYLHRGDTAEVSMQYSFLPSWMSFLVDQTKAAEAGHELITAVLAEIDQLPEEQRPTVLLFGESLGSYGTEETFADLADLRNRVDGALLVGPTFANPMWERLTAERDPGSPQWLPSLAAEPGVRFARTPADLEGFADTAAAPRVVYLQNASDPITWWNVPLAYRRPAWAGEPAAPDRAGAFRWIPIVTFWQTAVDLANSLGVPAGHGHYFGTNVVDAWAAVAPPEGWRSEDTERLRALLATPEE